MGNTGAGTETVEITGNTYISLVEIGSNKLGKLECTGAGGDAVANTRDTDLEVAGSPSTGYELLDVPQLLKLGVKGERVQTGGITWGRLEHTEEGGTQVQGNHKLSGLLWMYKYNQTQVISKISE